MNLFNFTIIALGIMLVMYLAGVGNTNSSLILDSVLAKNTTQITSSAELPTGATSITGFISFTNWWVAIGILLAGMVIISAFKISIGGYQVTPNIDIIYAVFAGGIYTVFVMDIISLITYLGSITGYAGWEFWTATAILLPFGVMYSFALISWLKGVD